MTGYTVDIRDLSKDDLAVAGGKGANLGELIRAGFPVPPGFVLTTAAYRDFLAAATCSNGPDEPRVIEAARMPEDITAAALEAYRALAHTSGCPAVAVRSSGTAEDLTEASFAGQHDTFLNVTGEEELLAAVRKCWASLWNPRAVAYRESQGIDDRDVALAVVVQQMVDAEWAGVLFTADPVTGARDRIVVESVRGLGEALVSGTASGHRDVVDRGNRRPLTPGSPLPPGVLAELARLATEVERMAGRPQDIEWVYTDGRCWLVQARALTALPDPPPPRRRERELEPRVRRALTFAADHMPQPPYPIDLSLAIRPALGWMRTRLQTGGFAIDGDIAVELGDGVVQFEPPRVRPTARAIRGIPRGLPRVVRLLRTRPEEWRARFRESLLPLVKRTEAEDLTVLSREELVGRVESLIGAQSALVPARFGCVVPRIVGADAVLKRLLRLAAGPDRAEELHTGLLAGVPCVTRDANLGLEQLAARAAADPTVREVYAGEPPYASRLTAFPAGQGFLSEVEEYLDQFGYRQTEAPLVGFPPLRENPEALHALIAGLSRTPRSAADVDRADRARSSLRSIRGLRRRLPVRLALRLVPTVRAAVAIREDSHAYLFMYVSAAVRRVLLELGRRLVETGELDEPADVLLLEFGEIADVPQDVREIVARRKAARNTAIQAGYTMFPADLLLPETSGDVVRGAPASRGTAVGTVRVVRGEHEFGKLAAGDVLVCPYTNPAWTPLFTLASAVVADLGGVTSHAAIVAREYGIPAVMATGDGTRALTDGQRVRVDGSAGTVTPLDPV